MPVLLPAFRDSETLLSPLQDLRGLAAGQKKLLEKVARGKQIIDLLFTLPEKLIDRRLFTPLPALEKHFVQSSRDFPVTTSGRVIDYAPAARAGLPHRMRLSHENAVLEVAFFQKKRRPILPGTGLFLSGHLGRYREMPCMTNPDYCVPWEKRASVPGLEPIWPLTAGLWPSTLRRAMKDALDLIPDVPEWQDQSLLKREGWPDFRTALLMLHAPDRIFSRETPLEEIGAARKKAAARLAADEILANQLCLGLARFFGAKRKGLFLPGTGALRGKLAENFSFPLTASQKQALEEITADMAGSAPMNRLLQGDVGSGKSIVAFHAALQAVESGFQAALMAPTETLARQLYENATRLLPVKPVYLSSAMPPAEKRKALESMASGEARIILGTHALIQEKVRYACLGLAIVDEQHRFGVSQRMQLCGKGTGVNLLAMSATPIPRTLQLTEWGQMKVSRLAGKPPGRQKITTTLHSKKSLPDLLDGIERLLRQGKQIYWVCPLVEENSENEASAAEKRFAELQARWGEKVGLVHGRLDIEARQRTLAEFRNATKQILVATTVIEVGVDIPNATVMIIEEAERFGLAQLHQLRGRVGRGSAASHCLLVHDASLSASSRDRLALLRETEDGFYIAEKDFSFRGGGEAGGRQQSGFSAFRLANFEETRKWVPVFHKDSARLLSLDPGLKSKRGEALRFLLHLFHRESPEILLSSG